MTRKLSREWLEARSTPEPNTGCWLWLGARKGNYPGFKSGGYVHRAVLGLKSRRRYACHTCDQKMCVNPDHLYAGDAFSNMQDYVRRQGHHNSRKTACPRGHHYDATVWTGKYWARACQRCINARAAGRSLA
jgi:hypothetical protein